MKNKHLLLILVALCAVYLGSKVFSGRNAERNFQSLLMEIDSSKVQKVTVKMTEFSYTLIKENGKWFAEKDGYKVEATKEAVQSLLSIFTYIESKQLVSRSPEKWTNYEVGEEKGAFITLYGNNEEELGSCVLGRFNFNQQTRSGISYIRVNNADEVYAIEGFAALSGKQDFNAFRDKSIITLNKSDVQSINLVSEDQESHNLIVSGSDWIYNDEIKIDSSSMVPYLSGISSINGATFYDDFEKESSAVLKTLNISANNTSEVIINCYKNIGEGDPFILNSSQNPDAFFGSDSLGIFKRIFLDIPIN